MSRERESMTPPPEPPAPSALPRDPGHALFAGRTAVVTGGAHGIGAGIVRALAYHGARVVLADQDADAAAGTAERAKADGAPVPVETLIGDLTRPATVQRLLDAAGGHADLLVNNLGDFLPAAPFLHSTEEDWERMHQLNFLHVLRVTRAFLPGMVERRYGRIVNLSSVEGERGIPGNAVYGAYKAAVINLTRSLASELGQYGIRVNGIAPDLTDTRQTPMWDLTLAKYADQVPKWLPAGRYGHPADFGDAAVYLLSDASSFMTGHTLRLDGGTNATPGWFRRDEHSFTNVPRPLR
jgi:NAD(P)-dependent dehydrogenase (short-subunit alcohol dehydrogenase family)